MESIVKRIQEPKNLIEREVEDDIRNTEARINYYTTRKDVFDPLIVEIEKAAPVTTVNLDTTSLDISVAGNKDTFKTVFGIMRKHGFEPSERPPEDGEPSYVCYWHRPEGGRIWFRFNSTQCRRVKVGTKMVEQDVYETRCD